MSSLEDDEATVGRALSFGAPLDAVAAAYAALPRLVHERKKMEAVVKAAQKVDDAREVSEFVGMTTALGELRVALAALAGEGDPNICLNCAHSRALHFDPNAYIPGKCNHQYDLCNCTNFVPEGQA